MPDTVVESAHPEVVMANINIERKRPLIRPYVIGLVLLIAVIWTVVQVVRNDAGGTGSQIESRP